MYMFFTQEIRDGLAVFGAEEARHCIQVLRHRAGDSVSFTDGRGYRYRGEIMEIGKKGFTVRMSPQDAGAGEPRRFRLHLGISLLKHMERMEWFMEKATEFGVAEVSPLVCDHSERRVVRKDRLEKTALAAMKQSMQVHLPTVRDARPFGELVREFAGRRDMGLYIAHCHHTGLPPLQQLAGRYPDSLVLIGPEGDFSTEEVALAEQSGFSAVGLGTVRLRAETAGIAVCHLFNLVH